MVLQKRSNYGSSGYQVAAMVHFPRSAKGKRSIRRKIEENQMCAFDLLATVAGKLLEGESFARASIPTTAKQSVKQKQSYNTNPVKVEAFEDGSYNSKERSPTPNTVSGHASVLTNFDASYKYGSSRKSIISGGRDELVISPGLIAGKCSIPGFPLGPKESCEFKIEDGINTPRRAERMSGDLIDSNRPGSCSLEDPMDMDSKPPALVSSGSSIEVPLIRDRLGMKLAVNRDDDENSSGCTHASTSKAFKNQRIGDRRIRKLLASKFWKVAPTMFKDAELSDTERKPVLRGRKLCYTRQRTQRCTYKRRKLFERYTVSPSDGVLCGEGPSNSPKGSVKVEPGISQSKLHAETGAFSPTSGKDPLYESGDFEVKFSIKSFKVPELFIEIPKTATVGSLKRMVMDAVTAALGGELRVGVYLQGKKVKCDSKTLLQAGISHTDELDNLDFTLEPSLNQAPPTEDPQFILLCDTTVPLTSTPAMIPPNQGASNGTMASPAPLVNSPESDHDSVQSPTGLSSPDKAAGISKALVPVWVPAERVEPLSVVPPPRKGRLSDLIQRRIRRPFSVTEVEALVQAVEKLGTGRWRDVKIRAFDNAKHRTYVDLKDKWKTLVHTARISPQQRRGEPVPQELLDRVLAAHGHWTQQQAKFQVKPSTSTEEPPLLLV